MTPQDPKKPITNSPQDVIDYIEFELTSLQNPLLQAGPGERNEGWKTLNEQTLQYLRQLLAEGANSIDEICERLQEMAFSSELKGAGTLGTDNREKFFALMGARNYTVRLKDYPLAQNPEFQKWRSEQRKRENADIIPPTETTVTIEQGRNL